MSRVPNCKDYKEKIKDTPGPGYYEKQEKDLSTISDHGTSANNIQ